MTLFLRLDFHKACCMSSFLSRHGGSRFHKYILPQFGNGRLIFPSYSTPQDPVSRSAGHRCNLTPQRDAVKPRIVGHNNGGDTRTQNKGGFEQLGGGHYDSLLDWSHSMGLDLLGRIKRHTEEVERCEGKFAREVSLVSSRATSAPSVKKVLAK